MVEHNQMNQIIAELCRGISAIFPEDRLEPILFGSYARGEADEHSDIDLRIEPGKINSLFLLSGFYTDVKESLNKDIDIISDLPDNQNFCDNLHKEEILLYDA